MRRELGGKFIQQLRLHEFVFIRDVETNDTFAREGLREFPAQTVEMAFLHAKDEVGPADVSLGDHDPRVGLSARRADLI
jgi:hypothetical protein